MRLGLLSLAGALALEAGAAMAQDAPADLIVLGGPVYTPDGWAEAVAVRNGLVAAVGEDDAVLALRGPDTRLIELDGKPLFPGLNDSHAHPYLGMIEQFAPCKPRSGTGVLAVLAECIAKSRPGEWIMLSPVFPGATNIRDLDAISPANPVILRAGGGHDVLVNSLALEAAGIDRDTPAPEGGKIAHDAAGEPTGLLSDVGDLVYRFLPPPSPESSRQAVSASLAMMRAAGVTSVTDANFLPESARPAFAAAADAGELKMRVRGCTEWSTTRDADEIIATLSSGIYDRELFDPRCVKIFVDGTSASRTAALLQPYVSADGTPTDETGSTRVPQDLLNREVVRFDKAGLSVIFHAWGDAAIDAALTAIETARAANGPDGPPHQLAHSFLVRASDIPRAKAVGAVFEFSGTVEPLAFFIMGGPIGAERMARAAPVREVLDAGAIAVGGTDWGNGVPGYNPWQSIQSAATRTERLSGAERVTLDQAIAMWTSYPALASSDPSAPGIIAPGRKADLVVLDRNPLAVPATEVNRTRTVMTILGGEVVYEAPPTP
jgi:predicted amidohydrolase YtcJ